MLRWTAHDLLTRSGATMPAWLPEDPNPDALPFIDPVVEIGLGDTKRLVSARILRLAGEFIMDAENRTARGQDCAVFALACATGIDLAQTTFNRPGGHAVNIGVVALAIDPVEAAVAQIEALTGMENIVGTSSQPNHTRFYAGEQHYLVRVTEDDGPALYVSKLGATGPVILSTLKASMIYSPTQTVAFCNNFDVAEIPLQTSA